jgi:hypothetical protein
VAARTLRQLPRQRMLPTAGSKQEDVHEAKILKGNQEGKKTWVISDLIFEIEQIESR